METRKAEKAGDRRWQGLTGVLLEEGWGAEGMLEKIDTKLQIQDTLPLQDRVKRNAHPNPNT